MGHVSSRCYRSRLDVPITLGASAAEARSFAVQTDADCQRFVFSAFDADMQQSCP